MAASAGGLNALSHVLSSLSVSLPASILIVQHLAPQYKSVLAEILSQRTGMHVQQAEDGLALALGAVYVAPPDFHMLVTPAGTISLSQSPVVHFLRPSADLLFESAATSFGAAVIAVVLSGTGTDGVAGVRSVKKHGGTVFAQDEATSEFFGMPGAAIATGCVDYVLALDAIGPALIALVGQEAA